jgi:hypothetical protein
MNNGAHVLVVGRDPMLLQTRKLILGSIVDVEAAGRVPEAEAMMANRRFDLIVLCYSLADDEYTKMVGLAHRQKPRPKILTLLSAVNPNDRGGADQELMVENGPYALMKKSAEILDLHLKGMGRLATS